MKILGIDYGIKRAGLAVGDTDINIAKSLEMLDNRGISFIIEKIKEICKKENIGKIVLGLPLGLSGKDTPQTKAVKDFACELRKVVDIPVILEDERFTTRIASEALKLRGIKRERKKKRIDSMAAQLILQGYLEKLKN